MGSGSDLFKDPLQLGLTIVGVTALFGGAGWWLDKLLGTFPILLVIGAVVGMFGFIYLTILRLRESDQSDRDDNSIT